jgi:hypothetical protein
VIESDDLGPKATLAAGLLQAAGQLETGLAVGEARTRLRSLLTDASLWSGGVAPVGDDRWPAQWAEPTVPVGGVLAAGLGRALDTIVGELAGGDTPVLRVSVATVDDADRIKELAVEGLLVVPAIPASVERFQWRWPLRVGVAAGPTAERWVGQLRRIPDATRLFEVRVENRDLATAEPLDILLVDGDATGLSPADMVHPFQASCVIVVGSSSDAADLLDRASEVPTAISVGAPVGNVRWFQRFVESMARDLPLDVAIASALPSARVRADPEAAALTAVGRWGRELSVQLRPIHRPTAGTFSAILGEARFGREGLGAGVLASSAAGLESVGIDPVVVVDRTRATATPMFAEAEAEPEAAADAGADGEAEAAPPRAGTSPGQRGPRQTRQLLADVEKDGAFIAGALRPRTAYRVVVRIAIPTEGQVGVELDEAQVPTGTGVADLVVDVSEEIGGTIESRHIKLPTIDRSLPSSNAVIPFRTGSEGTTLHLRITVLYEGRAILAAALIAPIRRVGVPGDQVQVLPALLTSRPEPDLSAAVTTADASIDARRTTVSRLQGEKDQFVDLTSGGAILERVSTRASNVLGLDSAPRSIEHPDSLRLLIQLARDGRSFRRLLDPLGLDGCKTIEVVVAQSTPIIPFELVYEGPTPSIDARLCRHRVPPAPGVPCKKAATDRVCPYAFWGSYRTFARTIQYAHSPRSPKRRPLAPLALSPALYAAADRADHDSRAKVLPTGKVEAELRKLVGADAVRRVDTWPKWRAEVGRVHPQLLVVLGHSDTGPNVEPVIEIGTDSLLAQPDVTSQYLGRARTPAPLVLLLSCSSGVDGSPFGTMAATFTQEGAAAVVATLTQLTGPQGASAAIALLRELHPTRRTETTLGAALTEARRSLLAKKLVLGLLLVSHGEIDIQLT